MSHALTWRRLLHDHGRLVEAATACPAFDDPAAVTRLRRLGDAAAVAMAIDLVVARRKASGKLPRADALVADAEGVEQATSAEVAAHKARRFATRRVTDLVDLCCGIGGDALALAEVADVTLIDRDANRAWAARHNVELATGRRCPAAAADVRQLDLHGRAVHLDPARRDGGRRLQRFADYQPPPAFIASVIDRCPAAAVKLGPGVDPTDLPDGEVEFISEAGTLVQAVLWSGALRCFERSATVLPADVTLSGTAGRPPPIAPLDRYLLTVDPAVERAGLIAELCDRLDVACVHPKLGIVTAARPVGSPFVRGYEVVATMPWREAKVRHWLVAHDAGLVTVKTRGRAVDPDPLQQRLRGEGARPYTVFIYRYEQPLVAHITAPLEVG